MEASACNMLWTLNLEAITSLDGEQEDDEEDIDYYCSEDYVEDSQAVADADPERYIYSSCVVIYMVYIVVLLEDDLSLYN